MNDYHVPLWGVLAGTAWLLAIALMTTGWVLILGEGKPHLGIMFGLTAMLVSSAAISLTATLIAGAVMTQVERGSNGKGI